MPSHPFYRSAHWRRLRAAVLREHPVCATPGCTREAVHVDHKRPIAAGGAPLDPFNLEPLCVPCHSRKTAAADGGFGNPRGGRVSGLPGCSEDGTPVDPRHGWNRSR